MWDPFAVPKDGKLPPDVAFAFALMGGPGTKPAPLDDNWMRVAPGTDAAIWRPWNRETGEL